MTIKGILETKNDTLKVSEKFSKREFVLKYAENPEYPEYLKLELQQDKCNLIDNVAVGATIEVDINLKGRKWTNPEGKDQYFNTLVAWKIKTDLPFIITLLITSTLLLQTFPF